MICTCAVGNVRRLRVKQFCPLVTPGFLGIKFFPLRNATKNTVLGAVPGSGVTGWPDGVQLDMGD